MKFKLVRSNGCFSAVVNEKSYFAFGKGTLKGKIYTVPKAKEGNK